MAVRLSRKALDAMRLLDGQVPTSITLAGTNFLANGHPILTQVPSNIVPTPSPFSFPGPDKTKNNTADGCFVGFGVEEASSRHVVPLGKLSGITFMSIFSDLGRPYVILIPLIEGSFGSSLQPGIDDNVDICVESGSTKVCGSSFRSCVYMHVGEDPYSLVKEAMNVARVHLGTFRLLHEKSPPDIVDKFGWCTWDAFYRSVSPKGVWDGVKALQQAGCPPGMVIIDDGWQSVCLDDDPIEKEGTDRAAAGEEKAYMLVKFQENYRFEDYKSTKTPSNKGMGAFVKDLKEEFNTIKDVYVWHALCGYWGGIRPNVPGMPESRMVHPHVSPNLLRTMKDFAVYNTARDGVGLVPPEQSHKMYEGLHSHLKSVGIDGVKIDVIEVNSTSTLSCLSCYQKTMVVAWSSLKAYYKVLTASLRKHFNGNGVISSMQQASDFFFLGTETIALGRVGKSSKYGPRMPHGALCLQQPVDGNFIHPDWDMFQQPVDGQLHTWCIVPTTSRLGNFIQNVRAISGGPIYVSDSVGKHNFCLLKKLALPDGSILRCQHYALPTTDCLFEDPLHDGKTPLKIWNRNKLKEMKLMKSSEKIEVALEPLNCELLTVSPVAVLPKKQIQFAPIGLVNMLNSGGAIQLLAFDDDKNLVRIGVKGRGELRVFASEEPWACRIDGAPVEYGYDEQMVRIEVPWHNSLMPSMDIILFFLWRSLLEERRVIEEGAIWRIGNRNRVKMWQHKWLRKPPMFRDHIKKLLIFCFREMEICNGKRNGVYGKQSSLRLGRSSIGV
ncbi:hypothetical protein CRYUN_Cryun13aG0053300 [Craigia yunnanensis]